MPIAREGSFLLTHDHLGKKFPKLEHLVVDACGRVTCEEGERAVRGIGKLFHAFVANTKLV